MIRRYWWLNWIVLWLVVGAVLALATGAHARAIYLDWTCGCGDGIGSDSAVLSGNVHINVGGTHPASDTWFAYDVYVNGSYWGQLNWVVHPNGTASGDYSS